MSQPLNIRPRTADAAFRAISPVPWTVRRHPDRSFRPDTPPIESPAESPFTLSPSGTNSPASTVSDSDLFDPLAVSPSEEPLVAVIGVGYVGAHLVDVFSAYYPVIGFDVSEKRVEQLRDAEHQRGGNRKVRYECDPATLTRATHFLVSVPTLLRPDRSIDLSYLQSALKTVGAHARTGSTVVIESSVSIGTTRDLLGPLAAERGFFAGMSPERVDPGRTDPPMRSIPKIISALDSVTPNSLASITKLYGPAFDQLVPVSSPEVAEMTKLYENCQRMVCIAYANEMADACQSLGIDPYEVAQAAGTKPFGFAPYAPSLGVGGHCIPVNPFYLLSNCDFPLLEKATATMWERPRRIAERALARFEARGHLSNGNKPRVLVVGLGFKRGQSNLSNSPGIELVKALSVSRQVEVMWADALVPQEAFAHVGRLEDNQWTREHVSGFDLVVVSFKQVGMDMGVLEGLDTVEMWCP